MTNQSVKVRCVKCETELNMISTDQPYGLNFYSGGHYGSRFFDPMDGSYLSINFCDDCIESLSKKEGFVFRRNAKC